MPNMFSLKILLLIYLNEINDSQRKILFIQHICVNIVWFLFIVLKIIVARKVTLWTQYNQRLQRPDTTDMAWSHTDYHSQYWPVVKPKEPMYIYIGDKHKRKYLAKRSQKWKQIDIHCFNHWLVAIKPKPNHAFVFCCSIYELGYNLGFADVRRWKYCIFTWWFKGLNTNNNA